jgi:serine/threonine protein kinase
LKSGNVLLSENHQHAKLSDLGQSLVRSISLASVTEKKRGGTLRWRAPEWYRPTLSSRRADVWSFGLFCTEVATGKLPFWWIKTDEELERKLQVNPQDLVSSAASKLSEHAAVPQALRDLIRRCLQVNPMARPLMAEIEATLRVMHADLERAIPSSPASHLEASPSAAPVSAPVVAAPASASSAHALGAPHAMSAHVRGVASIAIPEVPDIPLSMLQRMIAPVSKWFISPLRYDSTRATWIVLLLCVSWMLTAGFSPLGGSLMDGTLVMPSSWSVCHGIFGRNCWPFEESNATMLQPDTLEQSAAMPISPVSPTMQENEFSTVLPAPSSPPDQKAARVPPLSASLIAPRILYLLRHTVASCLDLGYKVGVLWMVDRNGGMHKDSGYREIRTQVLERWVKLDIGEVPSDMELVWSSSNAATLIQKLQLRIIRHDRHGDLTHFGDLIRWATMVGVEFGRLTYLSVALETASDAPAGERNKTLDKGVGYCLQSLTLLVMIHLPPANAPLLPSLLQLLGSPDVLKTWREFISVLNLPGVIDAKRLKRDVIRSTLSDLLTQWSQATEVPLYTVPRIPWTNDATRQQFQTILLKQHFDAPDFTKAFIFAQLSGEEVKTRLLQIFGQA